jgi:dihydroorotase (multifunctional complex type)
MAVMTVRVARLKAYLNNCGVALHSFGLPENRKATVSKLTILIHGGLVVTPEAIQSADILLEGETIAAVEPGLSAPPGARVMDADGLLIFPGLIDPHVHLREPGGEHKEDLTSGTRAALAGGFTTALAMPNTQPSITGRETLAQVHALAAAKTVCDYGFFVGATAGNAAEAAALTHAVGLKLYMGSSTGDLLVADLAGQLAHFERYPGLIAVHAEDEEAVTYFAARGQQRPPLCAALSVARAIALAEHFQRRVHICHVSTAQEIALIRDAKARGVPITCEVAPHHLFLTTEDEARLGGLGKMNPPLRAREDVAALWANLDVVDCIATDHAPHTLEEKRSPNPPAGVPGLETALPLMLDACRRGGGGGGGAGRPPGGAPTDHRAADGRRPCSRLRPAAQGPRRPRLRRRPDAGRPGRRVDHRGAAFPDQVWLVAVRGTQSKRPRRTGVPARPTRLRCRSPAARARLRSSNQQID